MKKTTIWILGIANAWLVTGTLVACPPGDPKGDPGQESEGLKNVPEPTPAKDVESPTDTKKPVLVNPAHETSQPTTNNEN